MEFALGNPESLMISGAILLGAFLSSFRSFPLKNIPFNPKFVKKTSVELLSFSVLLLITFSLMQPMILSDAYVEVPARFLVVAEEGLQDYAKELVEHLGNRSTLFQLSGVSEDQMVVVLMTGLKDIKIDYPKDRVVVVVVNGSIIESEAKVEAFLYLPYEGCEDILSKLTITVVKGKKPILNLNELLIPLISLLLVLEYFVVRVRFPILETKYRQMSIFPLLFLLSSPEIISLVGAISIILICVSTNNIVKYYASHVYRDKEWKILWYRTVVRVLCELALIPSYINDALLWLPLSLLALEKVVYSF